MIGFLDIETFVRSGAILQWLSRNMLAINTQQIYIFRLFFIKTLHLLYTQETAYLMVRIQVLAQTLLTCELSLTVIWTFLNKFIEYKAV